MTGKNLMRNFSLRIIETLTEIKFFKLVNVTLNFGNYLNTVNTVINSHAPLKKLNKKKRKFLQKPWITKGIKN